MILWGFREKRDIYGFIGGLTCSRCDYGFWKLSPFDKMRHERVQRTLHQYMYTSLGNNSEVLIPSKLVLNLNLSIKMVTFTHQGWLVRPFVSGRDFSTPRLNFRYSVMNQIISQQPPTLCLCFMLTWPLINAKRGVSTNVVINSPLNYGGLKSVDVIY